MRKKPCYRIWVPHSGYTVDVKEAESSQKPTKYFLNGCGLQGFLKGVGTGCVLSWVPLATYFHHSKRIRKAPFSLKDPCLPTHLLAYHPMDRDRLEIAHITKVNLEI